MGVQQTHDGGLAMGMVQEPEGAGALGSDDGFVVNDNGWAGHVEAHDLAAAFGRGGDGHGLDAHEARLDQARAMKWFHRHHNSGLLAVAYKDGRRYWVPLGEAAALRKRMALVARGATIDDALAAVPPVYGLPAT